MDFVLRQNQMELFMANTSALALRIQDARAAAQLSIMEVSSLVAVKPETYKRWESGASEPRINKLTTLAGVLAVSPGWLLSGDEEHIAALNSDDRVALFRERIEQMAAIQRRMQVMLDELSCDLDDFTGTDGAGRDEEE